MCECEGSGVAAGSRARALPAPPPSTRPHTLGAPLDRDDDLDVDLVGSASSADL